MKKLFRKLIRKIFAVPTRLFLTMILIACKENEHLQKLLAEVCGNGMETLQQMKMQWVRDRYEIHPSATWGANTYIYGEGKIVIGEETYLGVNCMVLANTPDVKVVIGKFCAISHNVQIRSEVNKKASHFKQDRYELPMAGKDIVIGDYVWIGSNVFIKGGVKIGSNSIVGANSVVTHDIPENAVYGGVPARLICMKSDYK